MNKDFVPLGGPVFNRKEIEAVQGVLNSGWVAKGPMAAQFEIAIEGYLNINHAIAVTNCTSALHLALMALGVGKEDRVVVSDYTFPATGFAPHYVGADVVLCDVDPGTYNMNPARLDQILKWHPHKIKAIIVVHAFGQCAEMDEIMRIAGNNGIPVIEDAACALGARYKGRQAGTWGDIGCFSLHGRKGITTGEGGIVVTRSHALANKMRKMSEFGVQSTFQREEPFFTPLRFEELGYNYKMSDIQAAIGLVQLDKLNAIITAKRKIAREYTKAFQEIDLFDPPEVDPRGDHIWQSYVPLIAKEFWTLRNRVIDMFQERGVQTTIGTYALHRQPFFFHGRSLVRSGEIFDRAIALPIYPKVNYRRVVRVAREIWTELKKSFMNRRGDSTSQKSNGDFSGIEEIQGRLRCLQEVK